MRIGIETAIHLQAIVSRETAESIEEFAKVLANRYDAAVPQCLPGVLGMSPTMRAEEPRSGYGTWRLIRKRISTPPTAPCFPNNPKTDIILLTRERGDGITNAQCFAWVDMAETRKSILGVS